MNFKGHLTGGIIAGSLSVYAAVHYQYVDMDSTAVDQFLQNPLNTQGDLAIMTGLFFTSLFMSLFPDLDTASLPQRWFFRGMFVTLVFLFFSNQMKLFVLLAFVSLTPVLHIHRGWTHWKITPWILALILASLQEYVRTNNSWLMEFSLSGVWSTLEDAKFHVLACVMGHYTHLILDSRQIKYVPFIQNVSGHH